MRRTLGWVTVLLLCVLTSCRHDSNGTEVGSATDPRARLLREINRQGGVHLETYGLGPRRVPAVPFELFFDGDNDDASIAANLEPHPGVSRFYSILQGVARRPDVSGIFVGISEVMPDPEWPYSDHLYVITSASEAQVYGWLSDLHPDPPGAGPLHGFRGDQGPVEPLPVPAGQHAVLVWWD